MNNANGGSRRGVADVVFLLDATGSMAPCIDAIRRGICDFVRELEGHSLGSTPIIRDWRARVVAYRDRPDCEDDWIEEHPFVRSAEQLATQLTAISAHGGGTEPESLLDALHRLAVSPPADPETVGGAMRWRPRHQAHRVIIVFTDATFHPSFRLPGATASADILDVVDVRESLQDAGVWLHLFTPEFDCYESLSEMDRCNWNSLPLELVDDPAFEAQATGAWTLRRLVERSEEFNEILRQLGKSVSLSTNC